jgi:hypothetical protein
MSLHSNLLLEIISEIKIYEKKTNKQTEIDFCYKTTTTKSTFNFQWFGFAFALESG